MCGLAGIISKDPHQISHNRLKLMSDTLQHRGPDGEGFWLHEDGNCGWAHRRLAILDKSTKAAQPMHYRHYRVILNGEIYNYTELKSLLQKKGYIFFTEGDTEVIPAAYDHWGIDCLNHFDGMFAFALYNEKTNALILARDRFGEKPLYYSMTGTENDFSNFVFASEMKALWAIGIHRQLSGAHLLQYITLGDITHFPDKRQTFYNNIYSLPQGHYISIQTKTFQFTIQQWYQPALRKKDSATFNEDACIQEFSSLLETSVSRRLRSHVHTGSSLSGGIDSASIVATIKQQKNDSSQWKNMAFTAAFPGFEKDETLRSREIAQYLNLQQEFIFPTEKDWIEQFEKLMFHQEEPLQSSSILTQFLVYQKAKEKNIIVLLDGQGADEILGGYQKSTRWYLQSLLRENKSLFLKEKKLLVKNQFMDDWDFRDIAASLSPKKTSKALNYLTKRKIRQAKFLNIDFYHAYAQSILIKKPVFRSMEDILYYNSFQSGLDELLRYADRNAMAHSVEVRLPFLYHELVEFVIALPTSMKIRDGFTKWILRKSSEKKLPRKNIWAKGKTGYEPPQAKWMKHPQIKELIMQSRNRLVSNGILQKDILKKPIISRDAHAANNFDWRFLCVAALLK